MKKSKALKDILDHINTMELLMVATSSAHELMNEKYTPSTDILVQKMVHKINSIATNNEIALVIKVKTEDDLQDVRKKYRDVFELVTKKNDKPQSIDNVAEKLAEDIVGEIVEEVTSTNKQKQHFHIDI
jgi:hypothetical protein